MVTKLTNNTVPIVAVRSLQKHDFAAATYDDSHNTAS